MNLESDALPGAEAHARAEADKLKDSVEGQRRKEDRAFCVALPDMETTLQMARLAIVVYEMLDPETFAQTGAVLESLKRECKEKCDGEPEYKRRLKEAGGDDMKMWFYECAAEGTEAAVTFSPKKNRCTVIFRGTETNKFVDVVADISIFKTHLAGPEDQSDDHPGCEVHRGFHGQYYGKVTDFFNNDDDDDVPEDVIGSVLETALFQKVKKLLNDPKKPKLYVTGHSLGGALSVLFGTRFALADDSNCNVNVINFGCPKVGNEAFAQLVKSKENLCVQRVVHKRDIVTRVPNFGYNHVGHTIQIDEALNFKPRAYKWHTGLHALTNWNPLLALVLGGISDHSTTGYLNALRSHTQSGKNDNGLGSGEMKEWVTEYEDPRN
eukprot:CAMPEP_0119062770 /NCGR_PEP_ID=MMETSP1178-20130426/6287_1 /TAXON_ID=33656 /ORGANISM="unid sp, Strain CCMP2000" /LENGTH=380 /DNA_ID=CAMNT_0007044077 /DNA_START=74 /DNA_END=1216 /DNA_ORIENTATION=+